MIWLQVDVSIMCFLRVGAYDGADDILHTNLRPVGQWGW